ncbi:hypothetical protein BD293_1205 [Roseinatronobacter monicus]|uniref:Uncharacterized protein n=1 Tax=Roseinatronobacter monicus TaxID=393481 RepID=A0A543KC02_9RHOB|nr:hypothetical protein BD293_1205 [Roseinatronobacter monicus]
MWSGKHGGAKRENGAATGVFIRNSIWEGFVLHLSKVEQYSVRARVAGIYALIALVVFACCEKLSFSLGAAFLVFPCQVAIRATRSAARTQ